MLDVDLLLFCQLFGTLLREIMSETKRLQSSATGQWQVAESFVKIFRTKSPCFLLVITTQQTSRGIVFFSNILTGNPVIVASAYLRGDWRGAALASWRFSLPVRKDQGDNVLLSAAVFICLWWYKLITLTMQISGRPFYGCVMRHRQRKGLTRAAIKNKRTMT